MRYVLAIDQSTSASKAILFDRDGGLGHRVSIPHRQIYPRAGWVEHNAHEIFENCIRAIRTVVEDVLKWQMQTNFFGAYFFCVVLLICKDRNSQ
jgi:glycerol kinase